MLQKKTIKKTPIPRNSCLHLQKNRQTGKLKHQKYGKQPQQSRCDYEILPQPLKYDKIEDPLLLPGNIPLVQKENLFFTDFSLLNKFHRYSDIKVKVQPDGQKLISITACRKIDARFPRWKIAIRKMVKVKDPKIRKWGRTIRDYCSTYEKLTDNHIMEQKSHKLLKGEFPLFDELSQKKVTPQPSETCSSKHPFIQLKSVFKGYENHLVEVVCNELLLKVLGYTVDSFVSMILTEGFPPVVQCYSSKNSSSMENILDHYINTKLKDHQTPEFEATLLMGNSYVRDAKLAVDFSMLSEDERDGSCTSFIFKEYGCPYWPYATDSLSSSFNQDFMDKMCEKEDEIQSFLLRYYDYHILLRYSNLDKVCKIRELSPDNRFQE